MAFVKNREQSPFIGETEGQNNYDRLEENLTEAGNALADQIKDTIKVMKRLHSRITDAEISSLSSKEALDLSRSLMDELKTQIKLANEVVDIIQEM